MASKYRQRLLKSSGVSNTKFESKYAKKLMLKMGWSQGNGLGKEQKGSTECIQVRRRQDNIGLGIKDKEETNWKDQWWNDAYNKSIQKLAIKTNQQNTRKQSSTNSQKQSSSSESDDSRPIKIKIAKKKQIIKK